MAVMTVMAVMVVLAVMAVVALLAKFSHRVLSQNLFPGYRLNSVFIDSLHACFLGDTPQHYCNDYHRTAVSTSPQKCDICLRCGAFYRPVAEALANGVSMSVNQNCSTAV